MKRDGLIETIGTMYEQHSRWGVINKKQICSTLTASMGMGGGFVPMVIRKYGKEKSRDNSIHKSL